MELDVELVALVRPDGLLIELLSDVGLAVIAVRTHEVVAHRPRFAAAGGKSDSFDALMLSGLARTDRQTFRILVPASDATRALRALSPAREDLVGHGVTVANERRAELEFWPGAVAAFTEIDSPIVLALLRRYPIPADTYLGEQRMARFLARHHYYCDRRTLAELVARLR